MSTESKARARALVYEMLDTLIPNEIIRERIKADAATLNRLHDARDNGFYFVCTMTWKDEKTLETHTAFSVPVDPDMAVQIEEVLVSEVRKCSQCSVGSATGERN